MNYRDIKVGDYVNLKGRRDKGELKLVTNVTTKRIVLDYNTSCYRGNGICRQDISKRICEFTPMQKLYKKWLHVLEVGQAVFIEHNNKLYKLTVVGTNDNELEVLYDGKMPTAYRVSKVSGRGKRLYGLLFNPTIDKILPYENHKEDYEKQLLLDKINYNISKLDTLNLESVRAIHLIIEGLLKK